MNIKIQGGGEKYANTDTCYGVVRYCEHEDAVRLVNGLPIEPFFDQRGEAPAKTVVAKMDANRAKLRNADAKFFVLTVSPSQKEVEAMGATEQERSVAFKRYIREDVMRLYADGFGKGLTADDIRWWGEKHCFHLPLVQSKVAQFLFVVNVFAENHKEIRAVVGDGGFGQARIHALLLNL
jgi:hypothetical protein